MKTVIAALTLVVTLTAGVAAVQAQPYHHRHGHQVCHYRHHHRMCHWER